MAHDPLDLALELVRVASVTPADHGCQGIVVARLQALGFKVHPLRFGEVDNFYARLGDVGPNLCFAGHTDVVPSGDLDAWQVDPFGGEIREGEIIARGISDMKGGLAAMVAGVEGFLARQPDFTQRGSLSFLITGDEEGDAVDGTRRVLDWLKEKGERLDYCLVGEPTCSQRLGDVIKNGRRGSLNGEIVIRGVQGHVAYPHLADNPIHRAFGPLGQLAETVLDAGNADFQPSSFQFTGLTSGGLSNVIPGQIRATFNVRFNTEQTPEGLETIIRGVLDRSGVDYELNTTLSGLPFRTRGESLLPALQGAIAEATGHPPALSTGGGTSDARFISQYCPETLEFGLVALGIHQVNERCPVVDLRGLAKIYQSLLARLFPA
ncbi:MAG: succinyl-diaminopimelate desuccinylase [Magnetococcales bacterium]|nr:succinyl-diaminopimelate desuccinylase [Magnetococcales bacterium]